MKRQKKDPKQMFGENQEHAQLNSNEEISEERVNQEELFHGEKKFRSGLGILSILFFFLMFTLESTIPEEVAVNEVKNRISAEIPSGYTLDTNTNIQIDSRDFEVSGFDGDGTARMLIWDYIGDSNNEIQILVDGQVVRENHMLNSNVAAYSVPVPSVVTIRGVNNNAGTPITYAVKFPDRKQTLFNIVTVNGANQYTLIPRL
ncbi:hypothetical protein M3182_01205 [Mesobacillus maritimus]|uniref:hypothetical protein n=1 Tax=Mesobacillus maritimus TaxID=1643336 RepID=UPI00203F919A|nr:hypothetical protein [Mesobacillus maritimus]MCM3584357.1 hypothetical protein [Mesobacillus maritimus]MCM3669225.1 hypothetical protein [Mesobacillus maritimus]